MLVEPCVCFYQRVDKFQKNHAETFDLTFEIFREAARNSFETIKKPVVARITKYLIPGIHGLAGCGLYSMHSNIGREGNDRVSQTSLHYARGN